MKCLREKSSNCDVWELIPLCPFPQNSAHTDVPTRHSLWHEPPWPVRASKSHCRTRDDSWTTVSVTPRQCRNRYKNTHISYSHNTAAVSTSSAAVPLDSSVCLCTRRSKGLVTWQWSHTDPLVSTHSSVHLTLLHNSPHLSCSLR